MSDAPVCENWMHFHEINFLNRNGVRWRNSVTSYC